MAEVDGLQTQLMEQVCLCFYPLCVFCLFVSVYSVYVCVSVCVCVCVCVYMHEHSVHRHA